MQRIHSRTRHCLGNDDLAFTISLAVTPHRKFCFLDHLIKARAILSWNNPPPANQPNWVPVWGSAREATIQVEPRRFIFPLEVLKETKVKLPPLVHQLLDFDEPIATKPKTLGANDLALLYKDKGVPVHRFAFKELANFASGKQPISAELFQQQFPCIQIDPKIIDILFPKTDGDISFEELTCIGLDPNSPDKLIGIIKVKKNSGYSGGPCTQGSREYVSWWADFDGNGSFNYANPVTQRFTYMPFAQNVNKVLAQWDSNGDLLWDVTLTTFDGGGTQVGIDTHRIQLDNTGPQVTVSIVAGTGDCGKFPVGSALWGNFVARDRAIVNSQSVGHVAADSVGFCLEDPVQEG